MVKKSLINKILFIKQLKSNKKEKRKKIKITNQ